MDALPMCGTSTDPSSGESCNSFDPTGPCVVETIGVGPMPTPLGGTIVAGTYDLVSRTLYASPDAGADAAVALDTPPARETSIVSGSGNTFAVENVVVSGTMVRRTSGTLTTDGSAAFSFTPTCPVSDGGGSGGAGTIPYTVSTTGGATTINIVSRFGDSSGNTRLDVYLKR